MKLTKMFSLFAALMLLAAPCYAADHGDDPNVRADGRNDINDLYVFQSPTNPDNAVLIMTQNPGIGVRPTSSRTFNPEAFYNFNVDQDGDAIADLVIRAKFSDVNDAGRQNLQLKFNHKAVANGKTGTTINIRGGGQVTAGVFEDPFFFDFTSFRNNFSFCPTNPAVDTFAGQNVTGIVVELPRAVLGPDNVGVWASINFDDESGGGQVDRMGRPVINPALIPTNLKVAFNQAQPVNDVRDFTSTVVATLLSFGDPPDYANALAAFLLPDILTVNTASTAGFPNGRGLADDVIDTTLNLVTNGGITTDCVNANDATFPGVFPYLAPAN